MLLRLRWRCIVSTPSLGPESFTEWGVMLPDGTVDPYKDREEAEMNGGHGFVVSREVEIRTSPWQTPTIEPLAAGGTS